MAKVGAHRASELTGRSKSTIQRAMKTGKLSYEVDEAGRKLIDVSELERVFGLEPEDKRSGSKGDDAGIQYELQRAADLLEMERLKMRLKNTEDQLHATQNTLSDMREQRDQWQKQAAQILLTSQHTQKQADELKQELKERDRREQDLRQKQMEMRTKKLQAQNQNNGQKEAAPAAANTGTFWAKLLKRSSAA